MLVLDTGNVAEAILFGVLGKEGSWRKMRRERRWTSAGETPARELVRSTAAPIGVGPFSPASSFHSARRDRCLMGYADQMETGSAARGFDPLRVAEL